MSGGKISMGIRIYSACFMIEPRKKSFRSALKNFAPLEESDTTELTINLVSRIVAAGEDVSSG